MQVTRRELIVGGAAAACGAGLALRHPPQPALLFYLDGELIGSSITENGWTWPSNATGVFSVQKSDGRQVYWKDTTGLESGEVPRDYYPGVVLVDGDIVAHAGGKLELARVPSEQRKAPSHVRLWNKGQIVRAGEV